MKNGSNISSAKSRSKFLRTFGISGLDELPEIEKVDFGEPILEDDPAEINEQTTIEENA